MAAFSLSMCLDLAQRGTALSVCSQQSSIMGTTRGWKWPFRCCSTQVQVFTYTACQQTQSTLGIVSCKSLLFSSGCSFQVNFKETMCDLPLWSGGVHQSGMLCESLFEVKTLVVCDVCVKASLIWIHLSQIQDSSPNMVVTVIYHTLL